MRFPFVRITAAAVAASILTACSGTSDMSTMSMSSTPRASNSSSSPAPSSTASSTMSSMTSMSPSSDESTAAAEHNEADMTFAQMMIVHHQGAIAMADLAATRAGNQAVKDLAATIKAAQAPEIEQMTAWLTEWGTDMAPTSSGGGMDMGGSTGMDMGGSMTMGSGSSGMPGMMTDEQMAELEAASGTAFDKMFLEMMITHHQGAIDMAETEIAQGSYPDALELAQSIKTSQTEEIATMQQLLATL